MVNALWSDERFSQASQEYGLTYEELEALLIEALESKEQADLQQDNAAFQTPDGIIRFAKEVLKFDGLTSDDDFYLAPYQEDILRNFVIHRRVCVRGPHGLGKTAIMAICIWWVFCVFNSDVKIATTASVHRQLIYYLWPEVRKWGARADFRRFGLKVVRGETMLDYGLKWGNKEAFIASSNNPMQIEGAHASVLCYVLDESKAIPNDIFDAVEGAFSTAGDDTGKLAFAICMSTPGPMAGRFYDIQSRKPGYEDWWVRHVTVDEAIAAKRISADWVEQREKQWGRESIIFQNRVLGEFSSSSEDMLVSLAWCDAAKKRYTECVGDALKKIMAMPLSIGVDVARAGGDLTVITLMRGLRIIKFVEMNTNDTMQIVGKVINLARGKKDVPIAVDVVGVGAGVYDRLNELGYKVVPISSGESAKGRDTTQLLEFVNFRTQLHWFIRDNMNPDFGGLLQIPPDSDKLIGDLMAVKYFYNSKGEIKVESKDEIRKRIGRSTDHLDSVLMALWVGRQDRIQIYFYGKKSKGQGSSTHPS